jgi:hypothetical protein
MSNDIKPTDPVPPPEQPWWLKNWATLVVVLVLILVVLWLLRK